jgi:hypothetical protein
MRVEPRAPIRGEAVCFQALGIRARYGRRGGVAREMLDKFRGVRAGTLGGKRSHASQAVIQGAVRTRPLRPRFP